MAKQDSQTIMALFDSFALADAAAKFLKVWEGSATEGKFSMLSVVHETESGKVKVHNYGPRNTLMGAGAGLIVGLVLGVPASRLAGIALPPAVLVGAAVGAALGSLSRKEPDLTADEYSGLLADLKGGSAGLVIQLAEGQVDQIAEEIGKLEGTVKKYERSAASVPAVAAPAASGAT